MEKGRRAMRSSDGRDEDVSEEIRFTGLRPSWDAFWEVTAELEMERLGRKKEEAEGSSRPDSESQGVRVTEYATGAEWVSEWDKLGMMEMGVYKMPHGVTYGGSMNAGVFEGIGILRYPNGGTLEGFWHAGKLKYCTYNYDDGLKRDTTHGWNYCRMPDRRFYSEMVAGLRAADSEQVGPEDPPRPLPLGCCDAGDGVYSFKTKCVTDPITGEVLRIPTVAEEMWLLENARMAEMGAVGYRPDLYENWSKSEEVPRMTDPLLSQTVKGMLEMIQQNQGHLDSETDSRRLSRMRSASVPTKLPSSMRELMSTSSLWSRSTGDLVGFFQKIMKEMDDARQRTKKLSTFSQQCRTAVEREKKVESVTRKINKSEKLDCKVVGSVKTSSSGESVEGKKTHLGHTTSLYKSYFSNQSTTFHPRDSQVFHPRSYGRPSSSRHIPDSSSELEKLLDFSEENEEESAQSRPTLHTLSADILEAPNFKFPMQKSVHSKSGKDDEYYSINYSDFDSDLSKHAYKSNNRSN